MTTLQDLKDRFKVEVKENHIKYDWDAGWCYSYIDHPMLKGVDEILGEDEADEFVLYTDNWLYQHEGPLFHMSDIVGDKLVNQAETLEGDAAKEYAKGLLSYIEKYGNFPFYDSKVEELRKFIDK